MNNIRGPYLADMQLMIRYSKGIRSYCVLLMLFCKYAWVISFNYGTITKAFQKILNESFRKTSKI